MPQFDLRHIYAAKYENNNGVISYSSPQQVGDAMTANIELRYAEGRLYAESTLAEYMRKAVGGTISLGVKYIKDDQEVTLHCDNVVFAAGFRPDQRLYESIADAGLECVQIGDNVRMGKIIDAIHQGYNSMRVLEL